MSSTKVERTAPNPGEHILQLANGYMASACLYVVAKLGIPDHLTDGPKRVAELAGTMGGVHEGALYRILRALASVGVFAETAPRTFANTPSSDLLRAKVPESARDAVLWIANPAHFRVFAEMSHSAETGEAALKKVTGLEPFDYLRKNPAEQEIFNAAMTSVSARLAPAVLEAYDFSGLGTIADIGAGHGYLLTSILKKYDELKGIVFDSPHVVSGARQLIQSSGLSARCEAQGGDFFQMVPAADSYILKSVIHDWKDSSAISILKNCVEAMRGNGGKILLLDMVLSPGNEPDFVKWIDLEMLIVAGGCERTEEEFKDLLAKSGLRLTRIVRTKSPVCVIETVKA